jgi:TPR repeat protein
MIRTVCIAFVLPLALAAPVTAGPFEDGFAAHEREDYTTALKFWRPVAEQGDADAQYNLGVTYRKGQGVPQEDAEAVKGYRKAAGQGSAPAQQSPGCMYANGNGVPQDFIQAYMWSSVAAASGNKAAQENSELFAKQMSPTRSPRPSAWPV